MSREKQIYDCAANEIHVGVKRYNGRCMMGNIESFLVEEEPYLIDEWQTWPEPASLSILIPIYRSGREFANTVEQLLSIQWETSIEIILFVNYPYERRDRLSVESAQQAKYFQKNHQSDKLSIITIDEPVEFGLAEVYRRTFTTLIARRCASLQFATGKVRTEKSEAIESLLNDSYFVVMDDDTMCCDAKALMRSLRNVKRNDGVILGDVKVTTLQGSYPELNPLLKSLFSLFFQIKKLQHSLILTPRAASFKRLLHLPAIELETPYADQIWFANAAFDADITYVAAETSIVEEDYPSNAALMKDLGAYLSEGYPSSAIEIFNNLEQVLAGYEDKKLYVSFQQLLEALKNRDLHAIGEQCNQLTRYLETKK